MKVLITGAGGFLGRKIAELLIDKGHEVSGLSRKTYRELDDLGVKQFTANLSNFEQIRKALVGQDAVIHCAAKVAMWGKWEDFYTTNVVGTQNIIDACYENGIKKLVYTSSPSVVFGNDDLRNVSEETPYPNEHLGLYARSKAMAEKRVLEANGHHELATTVLRPHLIFGPKDTHMIPKLVDRAKKQKLRIVGDGTNKVDVIHIDNAAHAHCLAVEKLELDSPVAGKAYFLGQEKPVNLWDFINQILKKYDAPQVERTISPGKAYFVGGVLEKAYQLLGIYNQDPPMTRFVALQLSKNHYFDHSAAETELGYHPILSLEQAIETLGPRN